MSDLKKFKFASKFEDAKITIPLLRKQITKDNATDQDIEYLLSKFPGKYDHNFVLIGEQAEPQEEVVESKPYPSDEPSEDWTVEQLKAYAKDHDIKLGKAKKEASILKRILEDA
jgi:hypothetical protein